MSSYFTPIVVGRRAAMSREAQVAGVGPRHG